jgi:hypothetical protein
MVHGGNRSAITVNVSSYRNTLFGDKNRNFPRRGVFTELMLDDTTFPDGFQLFRVMF